MKKLLTIATLYILFCINENVFAQNNYYEFQRSIQASRNNAAYIDAIETQARTPNTPYVRGGIDRSVFARPVRIRTEAEEQRLAEFRRKDAEEFNARIAKIEARIDAQNEVYNAYKYMNLPILDEDLHRLGKLSITENAYNTSYYENLLTMSGYVKFFNEQLPSAKFEDLVQIITQYQILTITAIESVNKLKQKFPDRVFETDLLIVQLLPGFFEGISLDNSYHKYYPDYDFKIVSDQPAKWIEMKNLYMEIYKKYPEQVIGFLKKTDKYPNRCWQLSKFFCEKDLKPKDLMVKSIFSKNLKQNQDAEALKKLYLYSGSDRIIMIDNLFSEALIKNLDVDEIVKIATINNIPPADIFMYQMPGDIYDRDSKTYLNNAYNENDYVKKYWEGKNIIKLIRTFAKKGDKDAMTVLAIRISRGFEKEKRSEALAWIQKAADIEDIRSYENNKYAMVRTLKALKDISNLKFLKISI